ncbi:hypothetical protein G6R40_12135 [Chryseobacterium sp. POL2]|uniref:DUF6520 family protein n=1 Tax=Chryseobacterium sp. POL2 TaxID=2713414 RepID=UPI0013E1948E|nr:DUF6520 family protein [Chryseobacterium sp. POL2]QIG90359.1 hypothetical protein G6R40_12135 [Chryseobacterium sp. POL2]
MKRFIIPAVVLLIGTTAALASQASKKSPKAIVDAYVVDSTTGKCIKTSQRCSTDPGPVCTWSQDSSKHLFALDESEATMCGQELSEP